MSIFIFHSLFPCIICGELVVGRLHNLYADDEGIRCILQICSQIDISLFSFLFFIQRSVLLHFLYFTMNECEGWGFSNHFNRSPIATIFFSTLIYIISISTCYIWYAHVSNPLYFEYVIFRRQFPSPSPIGWPWPQFICFSSSSLSFYFFLLSILFFYFSHFLMLFMISRGFKKTNNRKSRTMN